MNRIEKLTVYAFLFANKPDLIYDYTIQEASGDYRVTCEQNNADLSSAVDKILVHQTTTFKKALVWLFTELREKQLGNKALDLANYVSYATLFTNIEEACQEDRLPSMTIIGNIERFKGNDKRKADEVLSAYGYEPDMSPKEPEVVILADLTKTELAYSLN